MKDFLITEDGDLYLSPETGDIELTDSVVQAIIIRIKWFYGEWRMHPEYGLPYYDEVFIKRPSTQLFASRLRKEIMSVDEVTEVQTIEINTNPVTRGCTVYFKALIEDDADTTQPIKTVSGEVMVDG